MFLLFHFDSEHIQGFSLFLSCSTLPRNFQSTWNALESQQFFATTLVKLSISTSKRVPFHRNLVTSAEMKPSNARISSFRCFTTILRKKIQNCLFPESSVFLGKVIFLFSIDLFHNFDFHLKVATFSVAMPFSDHGIALACTTSWFRSIYLKQSCLK